MFLPVAALAAAHEDLVVHAALNDEERGGDEGLLEELSLEHFDQVLDAQFLSQLRILTGHHLLLESQVRLRQSALLLRGMQLRLDLRLLLEQADLGALLECELAVLAVDALGVDHAGGQLHFGHHLAEVFNVYFPRPDQSKQEGLVRRVDAVQLQVQEQGLSWGQRLRDAVGRWFEQVLQVHGLREHVVD